MKRLFLVFLLLAAMIPSSGQNKKALKAENEALKRELAALRATLDSLQGTVIPNEVKESISCCPG